MKCLDINQKKYSFRKIYVSVKLISHNNCHTQMHDSDWTLNSRNVIRFDKQPFTLHVIGFL